MADSTVQIDAKLFARRLGKLFNSWRNGSTAGWHGVDAVAIVVGKTDEASYVKSQALQLWLLGYEFAETVFVLTHSKLHVLTSNKKAVYLKPLQTTDLPVPMDIIEKQKTDSQPDKLAELFKAAKTSAKELKSIGSLPRETYKGTLQADLNVVLQNNGITMTDVAEGIAHLLAVKDEEELIAVKHAAEITTDTLTNLVIARIEEVIEENKQVSHSALTKQFTEIMNDPEQLKRKGKLSETINPDSIEAVYDPIVQSGGKYNLKYSAVSTNDTLKFDVILLSLGLRYRNYCANVLRTLLIDPTKEQEDNYKFLLEMRSHVSKLMVDGAKLSDLYAATRTFIEQKNPVLKDHLVKEIGFSMGLEFREKPYIIDDKSTQKLRLGMVLCLTLGLVDLKTTKNGAEQTYSLLLGDTVMITAEGSRALTAKHNAKLSNISYNLSADEAGPDGDVPASSATKSEVAMIVDQDASTSRKSRRTTKTDAAEEAERVERQTYLMVTRVEEGVKRFNKRTDGGEEAKPRKLDVYKNPDNLPSELRPKIIVDDKRDCIILPINSLPVPFHITVIKSMKRIETEKTPILQITFSKPHEALAITDTAVDDTPYIRQINLRSADAKHLQEIQARITSLRKGFLEREKNEKEHASLKMQGALEVIRGSVDRLKDVLVRPIVLDNKRTIGDVELHHNGIRYTSITNKKIDILFSNIKHMIYQPSENEFITLLHIHLRSPIMIGAKKHQDIQFYREVASAMADDGRGGVSLYDKDELEKEQHEREERRRHEREFKDFGKKIVEKATKESKIALELDRPLRADRDEENPAFFGTPHRSTVLMRPTVHALVQLIELPWTVVSLDETELAVCERVQPGVTRSFDVVFINKNLKDFVHVNSIKIEELAKVQKWLTSCDIPYIENLKNTNWAEVLKEINKDPAGFYEDGGWKHAFASEDISDVSESEEDEDNNNQEVNQDGKGGHDADKAKKKKRADSDSDEDFMASSSEEEEESSDGEYDDDDDASAEEDDDDVNEDELSDIAETDEDEDEDDEDEDDHRRKKAKSSSTSSGGGSDKRKAESQDATRKKPKH